ncbi:MAG: response regulator [Deltaproteobacteria bacterium]|nr:MAG: response regulator [Deltaproteobacteria bacterium]
MASDPADRAPGPVDAVPPGAEPGEGNGDTDASAELARLRRELAAARRTIDVLVARIEREADATDLDGAAWRRTIRQLETEVAARSRDLAAREEYFRVLYEQSPDAILTLRNDRVVDCNPAAELVLGRDARRIAGETLDALLGADTAAALTSLIWSGFQGPGDSDLELAGGRRLTFSISRLPADETLLVLRDVTQRRRLEADLERARRNAGYGRLAAELACEITASLSVVSGRLALLRQKESVSPGELDASLQAMAEHCRRVDAVVSNLRALGHARSPRPRPLPVRRLIHQVLEEEAHKMERVRVQVDVPESLQIVADPDHSSLILRNLLSYLADHMPRGRLLSVRVEQRRGAPPELLFSAEGLAIPTEIARILRAEGGGPRSAAPDPALGLGLAITWALVHDNGGTLSLGEGGRVLRLRLVPMPGAQPARQRSVLVVDDDQLLCETVSYMLSGLGLVVRIASSAEEALRILAVERFDSILVDLVLPCMDGVTLLDTIDQRWPDRACRKVLTTGGEPELPEGIVLLRKPFNRQQLIDAIIGDR